MVNGRLLKAVEVCVERVAARNQSILGVQRDVACLLELVPDKRQRVDEVGMLTADALTFQFRKIRTYI